MVPLVRVVWAKKSLAPGLSEPAMGELLTAGEGTFQASEGWGRESFLLAADGLARRQTPRPTPAFQGRARRGPGRVSPLGTPGTFALLGPFLHRKSLEIVFHKDGGSELNITLAIFYLLFPSNTSRAFLWTP